MNKNKKRIGIFGLSFKSGTDDLRFSPALEITERLLGKGYSLRIYDKNVHLSKLMGKNKDYLYNKLPHINDILTENLDEFITGLEVLVIVNKENEINNILNKNLQNIEIVDLIRVSNDHNSEIDYEGICW